MDFNWDDYSSSEDDGDENDRLHQMKKMQRLMFIDDLEKHSWQEIAIDPLEFEELFGTPTEEDMDIITQVFIKDYLLWEDSLDEEFIYEKWGSVWIEFLLYYNQEKEEYELCSTIHESLKKCKKYYNKQRKENQSSNRFR
tara:strand:+ start:2290 stop:2709 length:420 start_codon:yes stop_codon:yes gene_type:complete